MMMKNEENFENGHVLSEERVHLKLSESFLTYDE